MESEQGGSNSAPDVERPDPGASASPGPDVAVQWQVLGRVQGVGFRWFVRQQARRWGVRGWVRNQPDGSVEIAAVGPADALEGLMASVRRGPPGADVTELRHLPVSAGLDYPDPFSILRG